jgi:hypothetical protein
MQVLLGRQWSVRVQFIYTGICLSFHPWLLHNRQILSELNDGVFRQSAIDYSGRSILHVMRILYLSFGRPTSS